MAIPNEADASVAPLAQIDSQDFVYIQEGVNDTGVISGCAVTAQGTPDNTVAVAVGVVLTGGVQKAVTAANVTITDVHSGTSGEFRLHVIVATSTGSLTYRAGTQAANALLPALTAGDVALAVVVVTSGETTTALLDIATADIVDKRVFKQISSAISASTKFRYPHASGNFYHMVEVLPLGTAASLDTVAANMLFALSYYNPVAIDVDQLFCFVNSSGAAGKVGRMYIYDDDGTPGYPGALIAETANFAVDTAGNKELTLSSTARLEADKLYWLAFSSDGTPQMLTYAGGTNILGMGLNGDANFGWNVADTFPTGVGTDPFPVAATVNTRAMTGVGMRITSYV